LLTIKNLKSFFPDKQRIIDEIEQGLDRQADEYHQYYRNSEDKLNQLSIEGSDLRHELQRKDSEVITLIGSVPYFNLLSTFLSYKKSFMLWMDT